MYNPKSFMEARDSRTQLTPHRHDHSGFIALLKALYHSLRRPLEIRRRIKGKGNSISLGNSILKRVRIDIVGNDNVIALANDSVVEGMIVRIRGNGHRLSVGRGVWFHNVRFFFEDEACRIGIGNECMFNDVSISAVETGCVVEIGAKVGLAEETDIRTSDSHSIVDVETGRRLNPPAGISIGDGAWIGKGVTILKGVRIGMHSVIGMRSIVTKDVPPYCLAAGVPAKVLRTGVTWVWEKLPVS
jgi:acetyltransferase-like isoleucine patch superfamily enzyme